MELSKVGILNKLFLSDNDKRLKKLSAIADKVLNYKATLSDKSDKELRSFTDIFKQRISKGESLDSILVEAYAVVAEAVKRVLGFELYKVQIMGAICLHQGRIAEMLTGEGKTVVETMPAYLNALTGKGVHIVTVNDYLADRDADWMGGVYRFLGLTVGLITSNQSTPEKQQAYLADITYGTNAEFGFDYLRDNMQKSLDAVCQRGLNYAIVDEVDSILIDEARTPLIISGEVKSEIDLYEKANAFAETLTPSTYIPTEDEEREYLEADGDFVVNEENHTITLTSSGVEKAEKYFKVISIVDDINLYKHIRFAIKANFLMKKDKDYVVIETEKEIEKKTENGKEVVKVKVGEVVIVDEFTGRLMLGRRYNEGLHQAIEAKEHVPILGESKTYATVTFQNFFRLYTKLSGMTGTAKLEEQEFLEIYGIDVVCIPPNKPVVRIDEQDKVYVTEKAKLTAIVEDIKGCYEKGQPVLVGTPTVEKSEQLSELLRENGIPHLLLNAKNHREEAMIIAQAGRKGSITVATNMAGRGTDIILGGNAGFYAVQALENEGYDSEFIDKTLHTAKHEFTPEMREIMGKYEAKCQSLGEALASEKDEVIALGGLRVIGTEKNENRRIDNQLRGRSGRQGDPGSSIYYLSFEDDLLRIPYKDELKDYVKREGLNDNSLLQNNYINSKIKNAQIDLEQRYYSIRKNVLSYDDVLNKQRESIYAERKSILGETNVHNKILSYLPDYVSEVVQKHIDFRYDYRDWKYAKLNEEINKYLLPKGSNVLTIGLAAEMNIDSIIDKFLEETTRVFEEKIAKLKEEGVDFDKIEKIVLLSAIDSEWIEQMDNMDNLQSCVRLKSIAQVNPITMYQIEGMKFFDDMIENIKKKAVSYLVMFGVEELYEKIAEAEDYPDELVDDEN